MKTNLFIENLGLIKYHCPIAVMSGDKICADVYGNADEPVSFDKQVGMFFIHPTKGYAGFTVDRVRKTSPDDENYAVRNRDICTSRLKEPLSKIDRVNYSGKLTPERIAIIKANDRTRKFALKIDTLASAMRIVEESEPLPAPTNALSQTQIEVTIPNDRDAFSRLLNETLSVSFGSNGSGFWWPYGIEEADANIDGFYEMDRNGERVDYCEEYEEEDDE